MTILLRIHQQQSRTGRLSNGRAGGEMVVDGTQADAQHSGGELSERGKQVWRNGSGMDGGSKLDGGKP
jgi:hypothetical protein